MVTSTRQLWIPGKPSLPAGRHSDRSRDGDPTPASSTSTAIRRRTAFPTGSAPAPDGTGQGDDLFPPSTSAMINGQ
ncbi:hypothetical protein BD310DRAFT_933037 [Dichomitus squalens]|uniref:Uncharacterized protein n=1 Tax=Dichomitus squalens TaxID=114155 RepID=A0A4V2K7D8_9APHY|nr:hypothetical protein BD310DRAFT_933037 [Dichomitus squalens]